MATIPIVRMFYGMSLPGGQLAGELRTHGHDTKIIFFKRVEAVPLRDANLDEYQFGDMTMRGYMPNKGDLTLIETSAWRKTKPHELQHLVTLLRELKPDAIGISTLSPGMVLAEEVTRHLRKHFDVPILWGGTGPTIEPDRSIEQADLVCVGEGEEVIVEIGDRLDRGESLEGIAGTWFRQPDGSIQKNPKRPVSDLDAIARPDWSRETFALVTGPKIIREMTADEYSDDKSYQIMTQRGCPFSCSFCVESFYQREFGKKGSLRRMAPEKAIAELKYARDVLGYKTVTFMDDVFTVNPRWLEDFLALYKKEVDLPFFCYTYPTTHNRQVLAMLEQAGCHAITMGVQSGSYRILTEVYDRPTKVGRVVEAAREIAESGIPASTFDLIPRTEFDKEADMHETLMLLLDLPKDMMSTFYNTMAYFPNYPIQEKFQDADLLASSEKLTEEEYIFYFKLFALTRTEMSRERILEIAADPAYRENHNLFNQYLTGIRPSPGYGELIELGMRRRMEAAQIAAGQAKAASHQ